MRNGQQVTIIWHVNDLKISQKDKWEITKIIKWLGKFYDDIKVKRGKQHHYLGMGLDFGKGKSLGDSLYRRNYKNFPEEVKTSTTATPAAEYLFQTIKENKAKYTPEEQAINFHHDVAKLLFVSTRARLDIQKAVAFLTTRVKSPNVDDWGKLKRVMKYLNGTRNLKLIFFVDNLGIIRWFVDASYAVHDDCKGYTGSMMTMELGAITSFSRKQKINGKSSMEAELIGVDDALSQILWRRYFMESQGYKIDETYYFKTTKVPYY